jgi:predicted ChrR family anti-sigma factor
MNPPASRLELPIDLNDVDALMMQPGYEPLRPGVDILTLYEDADSGAKAALLRYQPGAEVPAHAHQGYEHILVLSGQQSDERGSYDAGNFIINAPGTRHSVRSERGCLVLAIWQKPVAFVD